MFQGKRGYAFARIGYHNRRRGHCNRLDGESRRSFTEKNGRIIQKTVNKELVSRSDKQQIVRFFQRKYWTAALYPRKKVQLKLVKSISN